VYSLQALECGGRGYESVLELGFILCVAYSYVGRCLETVLFPVKGLLPIVYTEDSEIQKTKGCGCVGIPWHAERRAHFVELHYAVCCSRMYLYVTVCPITLPVTLAHRFWMRLTAHCVFYYNDFDDTPYWIRLATETSVRMISWAVTTTYNY
jgi:hypothetical protein